jgi:hypothetical protein
MAHPTAWASAEASTLGGSRMTTSDEADGESHDGERLHGRDG